MKSSHIYVYVLIAIAVFSSSESFSLERDYWYSGGYLDNYWLDPEEDDDGNNYWYYESSDLCYSCFESACVGGSLKYEHDIDKGVIPPLHNSKYFYECASCYEHVVYSGYFHFRYKGGYPFLKRQIEYSKKYPKTQAFWPETSTKAEKISDLAVILFEDLVNSTALKKVNQKKSLSKKFVTDSWYFDTLDSVLPISLVASCFRFSDFYQVSKDIVEFSQKNFSEKESNAIEEKTDAILDKLCGLFLDMYEESISFYPTEEIVSEIDFIDLLYNHERDFKTKPHPKDVTSSPFAKKVRLDRVKNHPNIQTSSNTASYLPEWLVTDHWLYEGIRCNDLFLHPMAVTYLTLVIDKDPLNIEAYQERMHAHFEMGNLSLAIEDFKKMTQLKPKNKEFLFDPSVYSVTDENDQNQQKKMIDYSEGFCLGMSKGGGVAVTEFVPSTWSCCKGILHGLWSLACSPVEVSHDLINTSYELLVFLKENTAQECLEILVPELKDLCENWDSLSEFERGNLTGYIIGKYGVDILAPGGVMKGVKKYRQLKRLNSMYTVECCAVSESKKAKIMTASSKHAVLRATVAESAKAGKIVPRNANVVPHVMQKKHEWGRLIKLSGIEKNDFKNVVQLLEQHRILEKGKKTFLGSFLNEGKQVHRYQYILEIGEHRVEAHFVEYMLENQSFLSNAWVIK